MGPLSFPDSPSCVCPSSGLCSRDSPAPVQPGDLGTLLNVLVVPTTGNRLLVEGSFLHPSLSHWRGPGPAACGLTASRSMPMPGTVRKGVSTQMSQVGSPAGRKTPGSQGPACLQEGGKWVTEHGPAARSPDSPGTAGLSVIRPVPSSRQPEVPANSSALRTRDGGEGVDAGEFRRPVPGVGCAACPCPPLC